VKRARGLAKLVVAGVEAGSAAVEKVQLATAGRAFFVLEAIPATAPVARVVHVLHDASVAGVHGTIRLGARALGAGAIVVLDVLEEDAARARETDSD
jgi:hypothetical protein